MTLVITEIHRTSAPDVGFLEGRTKDGLYVHVHFKYGWLTITASADYEASFDEADPECFTIFERKLRDGGYHITDQELVDATRSAKIEWPAELTRRKTGSPAPE